MESDPSAAARLRAAGRVAHRWLGLSVGALFVLTGLSGSLLTYEPELTSMIYPELGGPPTAEWWARRAGLLAEIDAAYPAGEISVVRFPAANRGAYEIYLENGERHYRDPLGGALLLEREPLGDPMIIASELHIHLFAGETGERVLGWLGLAMLALLLAGLWLWWPRPNEWRSVFRPPRNRRLRPQLYWWHKTIGAATLMLLLIVTLTGVGMVFYETAQRLLTGAFGGAPAALPTSVESSAASTDWPEVIRSLDRTLPDGRTVYFHPPAQPDAPLLFRKKLPAELHPNGRSFVSMTARGEVIAAVDDTQSAPGLKATHVIYPLHSGRMGSETWRALVAIAGILPTVFFITGFILWRMQRRVRQTRAKTAAARLPSSGLRNGYGYFDSPSS